MGKFGKWIGAGLGAFAGGPIGAIIGFTIGSMIEGGQEAIKRGTGGYSARTTTGGYVMSLLVLVAAVMKAVHQDFEAAGVVCRAVVIGIITATWDQGVISGSHSIVKDDAVDVRCVCILVDINQVGVGDGGVDA